MKGLTKMQPEEKEIKPRPTFNLPKRHIDWKAVRDMVIYDMGGAGPLMIDLPRHGK